jgi:peptidyl-prolyl cis-trans isomerase SurA
MKKSVVLGAAAVLIAGANAPAAKIVLDRIIARVNGQIVTQRQYDREKAELRGRLSERYSGAELEVQVREQSKNLLRDLIDQNLLVEKGKDLDIKVDTDVIKKLDEYRQQQKLASLEELQKEVEKQGMDWADFNDNIKRQLLMQQVIGSEVGRHVLVSREDARKYYDSHKQEFASPAGLHLAEILIATDKHKPDEVQERAKTALAEVKSGARFFEVAKKYSDGPSANQGGDIGFVVAGTVSTELEEPLKKMDTGDVSDIVQTKYGPKIVKVLERRQAGVPPFEDVAERVVNMLTDQKMQPALRRYLQTLRKESFIFKAPGYVDTGEERPSGAVVASGTGESPGEQ